MVLRFASRDICQELREYLAGYLVDFRSPISALRDEYPDFDFSTLEHDEDPYDYRRESYDDVADRARGFLDDLFDSESAQGN